MGYGSGTDSNHARKTSSGILHERSARHQPYENWSGCPGIYDCRDYLKHWILSLPESHGAKKSSNLVLSDTAFIKNSLTVIPLEKMGLKTIRLFLSILSYFNISLIPTIRFIRQCHSD